MASPSPSPRPDRYGCRFLRAFTLVELLVVISIVGVLLALVTPAVTRLLLARNLGSSAYSLADTLDKARSYAMANNTYVWVGLAELDAASSTPQPGTGTVILAAVASRDGTSVYDLDNPGKLDAAKVQPIDRPQRMADLHFASAKETPSYSASNGMHRPAADSAPFSTATNAGNDSLTPFTVQVSGSSQTFSKVIEFDPRGVARSVVAGGTPRDIPGIIELSLLPAHGTAVDLGGDAAAIQISGLTGATQVYRP